MTLKHMFQLCITAIIVTGCTAVYSPAPVGSEPAVLDVDEWNGTWIHSGGYLTMTVIGPEEARVRVGWVEGEKVETYEGLIRTAGDWMFGNVHNGPEKTTWLWGRILKESGKIILWVPSVEVFETMVKSGQLPGTIDDDGNVVLSELSPEHLRSIMSCTAGPAMDWEHPIALLRDPDPEILPRGLYKVYEIDDVNAGTQKLPPHPRIVSYDQAAVSGESGLPVRCLVVNAEPDVPFNLGKPPAKDTDPERGTPRLQIQLDEESAKQLEVFTRQNLDASAAVIIGGKVISIHTIRAPVTGGKLQITRCTDRVCEVIYSNLTK